MSSLSVDYDVIIVGLGIAGLTATLFLARQGLRVLSIGMELGGQLSKVVLIENFPGASPISGSELIRRVESLVRKYSNVRIEIDEVIKIVPEGDLYRVITRRGCEYKTYAVIIASGKTPRRLGVPNEEKYLGRGLSYCVLCDAPLFKNKRVLLVSTYKPSLKMEISILASYCSTLYWIPEGVPENIMREVIEGLESKVQVLRGYKIKSIIGDTKVRGVVVQGPDGHEEQIELDGIFVELGYEFRTDFVRDLVDVNEKGEVIVDALCRTSRNGIFAAGDITSVPFKQAIIAAGQGAIAALAAAEYLSKKFGISTKRVDWHRESEKLRIKIKL